MLQIISTNEIIFEYFVTQNYLTIIPNLYFDQHLRFIQ